MEQTEPIRPAHGGNLAWAAEAAGCPPEAILDFSANINPLGLPSSAIAAIRSHLGDIVRYPDPGYGKLRRRLADFHHLSPDWVLPGNGAAELLTWACRELVDQEGVIVPQPAFGDYERSLKAAGATIISSTLAMNSLVQTADFSIELTTNSALARSQPGQLDEIWLDAIAHALQTAGLNSRSCGLILNSPHNPTGYLLHRDTIGQCLEQFGVVIVDEAFMDFVRPEHQQSVDQWVTRYSNLVILRSLTKFYSLPGLRIGYAIAHPDRLRRWQAWRDPWPVNALAEAAAIAVLVDQDFQQQTWDWLDQARSQLFNALSQQSGLTPLPSAANFLLVQAQQSATQLQEQLLKQSQILIRDCISYPVLGDAYFRVAVRTEAENQRLINAIAQAQTMG
ncbi:MAG: threonine-phosphate decarboxylase CobD [Thainema sp.]